MKEMVHCLVQKLQVAVQGRTVCVLGRNCIHSCEEIIEVSWLFSKFKKKEKIYIICRAVYSFSLYFKTCRFSYDTRLQQATYLSYLKVLVLKLENFVTWKSNTEFMPDHEFSVVHDCYRSFCKDYRLGELLVQYAGKLEIENAGYLSNSLINFLKLAETP